MSKKDIFKNAVTNIDDKYIAEAMNGSAKKRRSFISLIAVAVTAMIAAASITTVAAVDLHRQRVEQKQAQKEAERQAYLEEKEKSSSAEFNADEIRSTDMLNAIKQYETMKDETQKALANMKNPKEVVFESGRYKKFKQLDTVSLAEADLSNVDRIVIWSADEGRTAIIDDAGVIAEICGNINSVKGEHAYDPGMYTNPRYNLRFISNGETIFRFICSYDGRFQCTSYLYCLHDNVIADYTVYDYTDEGVYNVLTKKLKIIF